MPEPSARDLVSRFAYELFDIVAITKLLARVIRVAQMERLHSTARAHAIMEQGLWGAHDLVDEKKVRQGKEASQPPSRKRASPRADIHVSGALRTAYEETVREDIPAEFLDLLGKLE